MQDITLCGFWIPQELAPYISLAADRKANEIPTDAQDAIDAGTFDDMAAYSEFNTSKCDYNNVPLAKNKMDELYPGNPLKILTKFCGKIETARLPTGAEQHFKRPLCVRCHEESILFIPLDNAEDVQKVNQTLSNLGVKLPKQMNDGQIRRLIVNFTGTAD